MTGRSKRGRLDKRSERSGFAFINPQCRGSALADVQFVNDIQQCCSIVSVDSWRYYMNLKAST
jgi:hypothetical protein